MELQFKDESLKFENKLVAVKNKVGSKGNLAFVLNYVFDDFLSNASESTRTEVNKEQESHSGGSRTESDFVHDELYIGDIQSVVNFPSKIEEHARLCPNHLTMKDVSRSGHVIHVDYICSYGHTLTWTSSESVNGNLTVNYRVVMGYLCSGMMPLQYVKFSKFAKCGITSQRFRSKVLPIIGTIINLLRKTSVNISRLEEKQQNANDEISIMTDARHACRKNSYHTDHVALGQKTHKVVDIQHITKVDERCSQKHETVGCTMLLTSVE